MFLKNFFFLLLVCLFFFSVVNCGCTPTQLIASNKISETDSYSTTYPSVAISPVNGDIVIVYMDDTLDGNSNAIGASLFDSSGNNIKTRWQINVQANQEQRDPRVVYRPDGKFIVIWINHNNQEKITGRIYHANGNSLTDEIVISSGSSWNDSPDVVSLSDNRMFVVWIETDHKPWGRIVNADGTMSGSQFAIRDYGAKDDYRMSISKFSDSDDVAISWYNNNDMYGARYDSSGSEVRYYGKLVDDHGKDPTIVAFFDDHIGAFTRATDDDFYISQFTDGSSNGYRRIQYNCYDGVAHAARDSLAVATCRHDGQIESRIVKYDQSLISDIFDVYTSGTNENLDLGVEDVHFAIAWQNSNDIYWSKYELKYPKYVSGLDDVNLDDNEAFDFTFSFADPGGTSITYTLASNDENSLPSWINHDGGTNDRIYGTAELSGCEDETFNLKVTTSQSCQMTETKAFVMTVTKPVPTVDQGIADQTVDALTTGWAFTFGTDAFVDAESLTYTAKLTSGEDLPSWLHFQENNPREFTADIDCEQVLQIRVTGSYNCPETATADFQLTIANTAPYKTKELVDQPKVVDSTYEYIFDSDTFVDDDAGDTLSYTSDQLVGGGSFPSWLYFTESEKKWHGNIPQEQCQEDFDIEIAISDGCDTIVDNYTLSVTNQPVSLSVGLDNKATQVNDAFEYTFDAGCFTDPELLTITYSASLNNDDPLPDWLQFEDTNPRQFKGTVPESECDGAEYVIKVVASDGCNDNDASDTYQLTITNNPPTKNNGIPNDDITTNNLYQYTIPDTYFTDSDGTTLTFEATLLPSDDPLPDWLKFEEENAREFKGTVDQDICDGTQYHIKVTVSDGCHSINDDFYLTVTNQSPTRDKTLQTGQIATTNQDYLYQFDDTYFSDAEGVTLIYEASLDDGTPLPGWLSFDDSVKKFSGTPYETECDETIYNIKVEASDGCAVAEGFFTIEIENKAPTNDKAIPDQIVHNNKKNYDYKFAEDTFSDPESVSLTYEAKLDTGEELPDWLNFDGATRKFYGDFPADLPNEKEYKIKVTASDTCKTVSTIFLITISNEAPYVNKYLDDEIIAVNSDFSFSFDSDSFIDEEGVTLTYECELDSGEGLPDWLTFNNSTRIFSGHIPEKTECDDFWDIKVTASDGCRSVSDIFRLSVSDQTPYIQEELVNQTQYAGNLFEYTFLSQCFVDPEDVQLDFIVKDYETGFPLPEWLTFDSDQRKFSGNVPDLNCGEIIHIKVIGSDACHDVENDFYLNITNPSPIDHKKLEPQAAYAKEPFEYTLPDNAFTNEDGVPLNYTAKRSGNNDLPDWLNFYPNNRTFSIEANDEDRCSYNYHIFVIADDGCTNATGEFHLELINKEPTVIGTLQNHTIKVEDYLDYQLPDDLFTDPEHSSISLSAELPDSDDRAFPNWLNFDESEGRFYGTADSCGDPYEIVVKGKDPCTKYATISWFLTIKDQPPIQQKELINQTFTVADYHNYDFHKETFIDPDERELRYEAKLHDGSDLPSWLKFDSDKRRFEGTPEGCSQILLIDVSAIDPCTTSITTTFQIEVINNPIFVFLGLKDAQQDGSTFFDYTIDSLAFDDPETENDNYEYTAEMENGDPLPDWLEFRSKEKRFIGDTPNENAEFVIRVYASDSCRTYSVSDTFTITVEELVIGKSTNTETLTTGATIGIILLSIAVVASLFAFVLYRNHLKKKYEKLWDGKQEFFTAIMPKKSPLDANNTSSPKGDVELQDIEHSSNSSNSSTDLGKENQNKQEIFKNKKADDVKSDIEVSDMSNESDLEDTNTDTSNSDSSLTSTSSTNEDDED
ncbi:tandem-95 repeat protein [Anaeramoeba flamelloides]|uniref:Tandem-95 repeat protein n=1 Tax=Anaeramoeba flamelloides TaxID=1746091 RepID=A0AAV8A2C9_9EUKA|nr:tandem-95 repeat protein [Anaeramoeba flamelloides]